MGEKFTKKVSFEFRVKEWRGDGWGKWRRGWIEVSIKRWNSAVDWAGIRLCTIIQSCLFTSLPVLEARLQRNSIPWQEPQWPRWKTARPLTTGRTAYNVLMCVAKMVPETLMPTQAVTKILVELPKCKLPLCTNIYNESHNKSRCLNAMHIYTRFIRLSKRVCFCCSVLLGATDSADGDKASLVPFL